MSFLDALAGCQSWAALNPGERPHRLLSLSTTMHWQSTELIQDSEAARWCFVWMRWARMPPESWYRSDKKKKKNGIFKTLNAPSCCFWEVSVSELLEIISFGVCVLFYFSSKCCSHASAHSRVWVCGVLTRRNKTSSRWRDWSDLPLRDFTPPKREEKSLFGGEREKKKSDSVAASSYGEVRVRKDARNGGGGGGWRSRSGFQMCELSCCLSLRWSLSVFLLSVLRVWLQSSPLFRAALDHPGIGIGVDRPQTRREATSLQPHLAIAFLLLVLLLLHIQSNSGLKSF